MSQYHKAIIAGGRDYKVGPKQRRWLDGIHVVYGIAEVVSGGAPGADAGGEVWARSRKIPVKVFKADWSEGPKAGPMRNADMARYVEHHDYDFPPALCILFPGGRGTASMKAIAKRHGLTVIEYTDVEAACSLNGEYE